MTTQQLSLFIENRTGRTREIVRMLSEGGINILAFTIADSAEFGILRLIVSDIDRAEEILRSARVSVVRTDVFWIPLEHRIGALEEVLAKLERNDISIEYMYLCYDNSQPFVVIRPIQIERCRQVLE